MPDTASPLAPVVPLAGTGLAVDHRRHEGPVTEDGPPHVSPGSISPVHVLQVFQPQTGGVPRYVAHLARGLRAGGWPVSVAGPRRALAASGLDQAGVQLVPIDVRRSPHPLEDGAAIRALAQWCRRHQVGVIHGHSTKASLLVALAARLAGVPSVYTPHCWAFERLVAVPLRASYALFERELAHRYHAAVLTVSASGRAAAERWRVAPRGRIRVIPPGLTPVPSLDRASARRSLGLDQDGFVAVWVGRAAAQKRPQELVPVARRLRGAAHVIALCEGIHGTPLAGELGAAGVRILDSSVSPATAYAAADVLVHTSAWEASPLVVLEAMSARLPVVAYDVGGVREQLQPGRTGYLVAPRDVEMLCECVRALRRRPELRKAMGEAGRNRIGNVFDVASMVDRTRETYVAVTGEGAVSEREAAAAHPRAARELPETVGQGAHR